MPGSFWDTSALVKHYHPEPGTPKVDALLQTPGSQHIISRLAVTETFSVFAGRVRAGLVTRAEFDKLCRRFLADTRGKLFSVARLLVAHHKEADKVLRVRGSPDWIMHFEFQSGPDASLPRRLHGYNVLLQHRHNLLVRSVAVLLRPQADLANVTGVHECRFADEPAYLTFRYQVIRIWQVPGRASLPE